MFRRFIFAIPLLALALSSAQALPARIIILRHGEKQDSYALCSVGIQRSLALAKQYLGKGAADSLFTTGGDPAGFVVITLHTLELASPAAASWNAPLIDYSVVPLPANTAVSAVELNTRTQQAAADVLTDPAWNGKTVVMIWEHTHIANKKLEKQYAPAKVTLRQLLNLDQLGSAVPDKWEGDNYDYFWIVTYGNPGSAVPTAFQSLKQHFAAPFAGVPHNGWGKPEGLPKNSGCKS
jgi:hypothetical protein